MVAFAGGETKCILEKELESCFTLDDLVSLEELLGLVGLGDVGGLVVRHEVQVEEELVEGVGVRESVGI